MLKESANCSVGSFYVKRQDARIPIVLGELPRTNERELIAGGWESASGIVILKRNPETPFCSFSKLV